MLGILRPVEVDLTDLEQRKVALPFLRRTNFAGDRIALAQIEAPDLRRRNIDIVGPGQVRAVGTAQEAETILKDFQDSITINILTALGVFLEDGKDDVLFA